MHANPIHALETDPFKGSGEASERAEPDFREHTFPFYLLVYLFYLLFYLLMSLIDSVKQHRFWTSPTKKYVSN